MLRKEAGALILSILKMAQRLFANDKFTWLRRLFTQTLTQNNKFSWNSPLKPRWKSCICHCCGGIANTGRARKSQPPEKDHKIKQPPKWSKDQFNARCCILSTLPIQNWSTCFQCAEVRRKSEYVCTSALCDDVRDSLDVCQVHVVENYLSKVNLILPVDKHIFGFAQVDSCHSG